MTIMKNPSCLAKKLDHVCSSSRFKLACLFSSSWYLLSFLYRFILLSSFWIQVCYFASLSSLGYWVLKLLKPRSYSSSPRNIDIFFTSASAATVSSMSTVEMEIFSDSQLIILAMLMFVGGEVFTSMVGLQMRKFQLNHAKHQTETEIVGKPSDSSDGLEFGIQLESNKETFNGPPPPSLESEFLKYRSRSIYFLGFMVLGYLLLVQILGISSVLTYLAFTSSARNVLETKGLNMVTFSFFTTISTFASCGFIPTNENTVAFKTNPGLMLILIPQILLGNTLFPSCLGFSIWVFGKLFKKVELESNYLLENTNDIGFLHLLPSLHSSLLVVTVMGFIVVQFVVFCSLDWNLDGLSGLNLYDKVVGMLFQTVNTRHTGESIVDLSTVSAATLVLFIIMMYLPPYTSFLPVNDGDEQNQGKKGSRGRITENVILSQLSYLVIFTILICITERTKIKEDPLNFNVLNIVLEVVSAYGNVGFSMGYSCDRQLHPDSNCEDKWIGFVGKWSDGGKIVLIFVMLFGRLKKFNMDGGKAWILL